jgi:hypothetical protein
MKKQKIALGFLLTSAVIMSVLLVVLPQHPQEAFGGMSAVGRNYILLTSDTLGGAGGDEFIDVIDSNSGKMVVYQMKSGILTPINAGDVTQYLMSSGSRR